MCPLPTFRKHLLFAGGAEPQMACAGASGAADKGQTAMSSDGEPQQAQVIELSSDDEFSSRRSPQVGAQCLQRCWSIDVWSIVQSRTHEWPHPRKCGLQHHSRSGRPWLLRAGCTGTTQLRQCSIASKQACRWALPWLCEVEAQLLAASAGHAHPDQRATRQAATLSMRGTVCA